jgi:chloramphenicol 3-O phosphotransferase
MEESLEQGNIIFLNGTSSSGKSLIAKALQEILDDYYIHTGIDHYLERVPEKFHLSSDGKNPSTAEGLLWVTSDGGKHVSEIRIGPAGLRLFSGMYRAYAALATMGNNIVIDDVIFDRRVLKDAVSILYPFNVLFVGVKCPFEIAEQREQERGDRTLGLVKAHYDLVHSHGIYDLEIDTSILTSLECANQIKNQLQNGPGPEAIQKLQKNLQTM